jgi:hypothetical protein
MSDVTLNLVLAVFQLSVFLFITRNISPMIWEIGGYALSALRSWMKMAVVLVAVLGWVHTAFWAPTWAIATSCLLTCLLHPFMMYHGQKSLETLAWEKLHIGERRLMLAIKRELKNQMRK